MDNARPSLTAAALVVFLLAPLGACAAGGAASADGRRVPAVMPPQLAAPAALTGDLSDRVWAKAAILPMHDAFTGQTMQVRTEAYVFWGDDALYVGFRCDEPDMSQVVTEGTIWARDCVEIFLEPLADLTARPYHQLTIDCHGNWEADRVHNYPYPKYFNLAYAREEWKPKLEVKAGRTAAGWTVEVRLPLTELKTADLAAARKSLWRLNVYRSRPARGVGRGGEPAMQWGWSPTGMKSFHVASRFGFLGTPEVQADPDLSAQLLRAIAAAARDPWLKPADADYVARIDAAAKDLGSDDAGVRRAAAAKLKALMDANVGGLLLVQQRMWPAIIFPLREGKREAAAAARSVMDYTYRSLVERDQDPPPAEIRQRIDQFEARVYQDAQGKALPYRLLKPQDYDPAKKYPLVIFLHGSGETGGDNRRQLADGSLNFGTPENRRKYNCFVVAPQCALGDSWYDSQGPGSREALRATSNFRLSDKPTEPLRLTFELLDALEKEFPGVDKARIYISGGSLGGFGTWEAIQRRPDLFAAAAPISGNGDETKPELVRNVAIHIFHGEKDAQVKLAGAQLMYDAVKKAGGNIRITIYPGAGHRIAPTEDPAYYEWLFAQKKGPPPAPIR